MMLLVFGALLETNFRKDYLNDVTLHAFPYKQKKKTADIIISNRYNSIAVDKYNIEWKSILKNSAMLKLFTCVQVSAR